MACGAARVSDQMFLAAAEAVAGRVGEERLAQGCIYPRPDSIREVSAAIAVRVIEVAQAQGLSRKGLPEDLPGHVRSLMFDPAYENFLDRRA